MSLDKRYQVFVSSTFVDLVKEREAILRALMKGNFIPAGMEIWPADTRPPLDVIYAEIDLSDFYVVVVGGKYGTVDEESGKSYTELEYEYALKKGLNVIALLHNAPGKIASDDSESEPERKAKLEAFRKRLGRHKFDGWTNADDLREALLTSLLKATAKTTAPGWVRGDRIASAEALSEVIKLRDEKAKLEAELRDAVPHVPDLASLDEGYTVVGSYRVGLFEWTGTKWTLDTTWGRLFHMVAWYLELDPIEHRVKSRLLHSLFSDVKGIEKDELNSPTPELSEVCWAEIVTQLRALGLIERVVDEQVRLRLTRYGESLHVSARAIRSGNGASPRAT